MYFLFRPEGLLLALLAFNAMAMGMGFGWGCFPVRVTLSLGSGLSFLVPASYSVIVTMM